MRRLIRYSLILLLAGLAAFWWITRPRPLDAAVLTGLSGDAVRGEAVFWAGGCASCHMVPGASGAAELVLAGGQRFVSEFGTFLAPNISSDPAQGIGAWTALDLANALHRGITPEGDHLYPAFPYTSYVRMTLQDVVDLRAFLSTLPADATPSQPHEVRFPFNIRRTLGVWKWLYLKPGFVIGEPLSLPQARGRYLAEALAHCGECHTPRGPLGGLDTARWLGGAPDPSGKGTIPNITPGKLTWTEAELVEYFTTGFTPDYDSVGGHMAHVVENLARLPASDRAAVAAYLQRVPPQP